MAEPNLPSITLNQIEKNDLLRQEPWFALIERFKELNVDVPKEVNLSQPEPSDYFKLKAYLSVHSSLSRNLLPHAHDDIMKYVNAMQDFFKEADSTGLNLYQQQSEEMKLLEQNDIDPALQTVLDNRNSLTKMLEERGEIWQLVSMRVDIHDVQEKADQRIDEVQQPEPGPG